MMSGTGTFTTADLAPATALERLQDRRRARRDSSLRGDIGPSPAEAAAERRMREAEEDRALEAFEKAEAEREQKYLAAQAEAGPALATATEKHLKIRAEVEAALDALLALLPDAQAARAAYEGAFSKAARYQALGEHVRILPFQRGDDFRYLHTFGPGA